MFAVPLHIRQTVSKQNVKRLDKYVNINKQIKYLWLTNFTTISTTCTITQCNKSLPLEAHNCSAIQSIPHHFRKPMICHAALPRAP